MTLDCAKCGRPFKNKRALSVHRWRAHGEYSNGQDALEVLKLRKRLEEMAARISQQRATILKLQRKVERQRREFDRDEGRMIRANLRLLLENKHLAKKYKESQLSEEHLEKKYPLLHYRELDPQEEE